MSKKWSIKRLYKESVSFRWGFIFCIFTISLAIIFFLIQQNQHSKNTTFFEEEFIKTQKICSDKNICEEQIIIYTKSNSLEGNCPHIHLEKEANTTFLEGTISLWIKLDNLDSYGDRTIFDMIDYNDNTFIELVITNNKVLKYKIKDLNGQEFILNYNNDEPFRNWTFIVATWDEKTLNLFINDKLKSSISIENVNFDIAIKDWYFGSNHNKNFCLNGLLDEVALFGISANKYDVINIYEHYEKNCRPLDDCYKGVNLWFKLKVFFSNIF